MQAHEIICTDYLHLLTILIWYLCMYLILFNLNEYTRAGVANFEDKRSIYTMVHIMMIRSLDRKWKKVTEGTTTPAWNYVILRFQIFTLYFMAGLKKMNRDWLTGYSVRSLSQHWVFSVFRFVQLIKLPMYMYVHHSYYHLYTYFHIRTVVHNCIHITYIGVSKEKTRKGLAP